MTAQPEMVKQSDLLNQLVLDRSTMEELGRVEVLWMHPPVHRVFGFICKSGFLGAKKTAFQLSQIDALGANGVLTHSQPEATDADKVRRLESLIHHEVWSDSGDKIGKITDCLFNLQTGEITHYLFVSNGWSGIVGDVYQLSPAQILSFGKTRVLVAEAVVPTLTLYREGVHQKLNKAREVLAEEATEEWRSIAKRAETATEQAKSRLQALRARARERAQFLSQEARERAIVLNDQFKEGTQTFVEQAKTRSQTLAEQLKEHTQHLSRQVEEGIETLTVQAEEVFEPSEQPPEPSSTAPPRAQAAPSSPDLDQDEDFWSEPLDASRVASPTSWSDTEEPWSTAPKPSDSIHSTAPTAHLTTEDEDDEFWFEPLSPSVTSPATSFTSPGASPNQPLGDRPLIDLKDDLKDNLTDDDDEPWI
jgi:uncharacterized protein YrrD